MFITLQRIADGAGAYAPSVLNVRLSAIVFVESETERKGPDGEQLCWLHTTAAGRLLVVRTAELDGLVT